MKNYTLLLFTVLLLFSCNGNPTINPTKASADKLFTDVMAIHDEVMPKLGDLSSLKRELTTQLEKSTNKAEIEQSIILLDSSNQVMMNWMRAFDVEKAKKGTQESINYLKGELQKVTDMKVLTVESIEKAKKVLN
ncbi:MAG: hypothetical protein AB8B61_05475 [Cyclobacteriaceae bacterium]